MRYNLLLQTLAVGLLVTALYVTPALAQWSTNPNFNNAISTAAHDQTTPTIVSDGAGGAIITWQDSRNGVDADIYAARVNASGYWMWTASVCTATNNQESPIIVSDGAGGAIITWMDDRSGSSWDIYAQRVNASGLAQWTGNGGQGIAICTATYDQSTPTIVSDGSGGAIITWQDQRNGGDNDIYAQRVNASGAVLWTANGVPICTATSNQEFPTIVSDGSGGAIITWPDYRIGNWDIYAQRVNPSGLRQWIVSGDSNGVAICTATNNQLSPTIVSDGAGGAIITWYDYRSGTSYDIYAQRVNASGAVQWVTDGVAICTATNTQMFPTIVSDGAGGAIITWMDIRSGSNYDIYAQRVNASGSAQWTGNGVAICTATGDQEYPALVTDGSGGAVITWYDDRNAAGYDIYAQRVNASGTVQWVADGVAICTAINAQEYPMIVTDGSGGGIITWQDYRNDNDWDIYAQKVDRYGYLGNAAPGIAKVKDVINDQGGNVTVMWNPSYLDVYPQTVVWTYNIYRGVKPSAANQSYAVLDPDKYSKLEKSNGGKQKVYLRLPLSPTSTETIYWQNVGSVNAEELEGYSYNVTTLSDSGPQGTPWYYFMVSARNSNMVFWNSFPDSGYSVDNLPPISPQNAAILPMVNGSINIHWNPDKIDPDVGHFSVYRSTSSGFPVNDGTRLQTTVDTTVTDSSAEVGQQYYYRVTAVDIHGNESQPTAELHTAALSVQLASMTATTLTTGVQLEWTTVSETNNLGFYVERRPQNTGAYATVSDLIPGAGTTLQQHHYEWTDTKVTDGNYNYRLRLVDLSGTNTYSGAIAVTVSGVTGVNGSLPTEFALQQNYPNPFNPTTVISYQLPVASYVTLKVYDMLGREVATLTNGSQDAGYKSVEFSAANLPSGIYTYKLTAGTFVEVKKSLLLK
ncbi:MAG: T9SS type A sorting domain-containing protein [Bacteroidota bacterium]|jgi:fibronectin type 3 domain-containing protein